MALGLDGRLGAGCLGGISRTVEDQVLNRPQRVDPALVDAGEPGLRVWVEGKLGEEGGKILMQSVTPAGVAIELPEPEVEGLKFVEEGSPRVETVGARTVVTRRFTFSGKQEMYELPALSLRWTDSAGEHEVSSAPVWLDLGVEAPRPTDPVDIVEPAAVRVLRLERVGAALAALALVALGLWVGFAKPKAPVEAPPPPPADVRALTAWAAVLADERLDDHAKAIELSRIFREYLEEVLRFPATAFTTTETLARLSALPHLPEGNVPRAKRLLRATDLVKFAEQRAGQERFAELDADLRAFIEATRVRGFAPPEGAA